MATFAVGDVHGNRPPLNDLLGQIRRAVGESDTVVFSGDYIDRGPDSRGCIDAILGFQREVSAEVVCLRGNHEDWLLRTRRDCRRHSWLFGMDAFDTIRSYSVRAAQTLREAVANAGAELLLEHRALPYEVFFDSVPQEHIHFFESLRSCHQDGDCVCAHGGLDTRVATVREQPDEALLWGAGSFPHGYEGAEVVVYGHRSNSVLDAAGWPWPAFLGRTVGIDTIAHGVLTAIRMPDQRVFQSARYEARNPDV